MQMSKSGYRNKTLGLSHWVVGRDFNERIAPSQNRTGDLRIMRPTLYQRSSRSDSPLGDAHGNMRISIPERRFLNRLAHTKEDNGHTGARTQDRGVISTALYQLSYTTDNRWRRYTLVLKVKLSIPLFKTRHL
jgi:hypothetical protein